MWKFSFPDEGICKIKKKDPCGTFFSIFDLNISSIKELLHKPSELQWNITGILPRKLKRKLSWALSCKIYPLKSQKRKKLLFWGVLCKPIQWFFLILWISESFSLYLLVKNIFNFQLGFFTYLEYISRGIIRKTILLSDYHSVRWYWSKKRPEKPSTNFT